MGLRRRSFDWVRYLAEFHASTPGVTEYILSRTFAGSHTPYHWLARAVAPRAVTVVDVACGSGAMSRELARADRTVIGVDLSERELLLASERGPGPWLCADARRLPLADASVDAVTSSMGVVVVQPVEELFREAARVLRPGGVFAFVAPTAVPLRPRDLATLGRLGGRLRSLPRFPGPTEWTGYVPALASVGLRKVEDARERYHYTVRTPEDAAAIVAAFYLPATPDARRQRAIDHLVDRAIRRDEVRVGIAMRRVVALKQAPGTVGPEL